MAATKVKIVGPVFKSGSPAIRGLLSAIDSAVTRFDSHAYEQRKEDFIRECVLHFEECEKHLKSGKDGS